MIVQSKLREMQGEHQWIPDGTRESSRIPILTSRFHSKPYSIIIILSSVTFALPNSNQVMLGDDAELLYRVLFLVRSF